MTPLAMVHAAAAQTALPPELSAPSPVEPAQALTLAQAEDLARTGNLQIQQASHQIQSARANLSSQRAPINPTLDYAALNNTVAPIDGFGMLSNYSAYVTIETNGARGFRTKQAGAQLKGSQADALTQQLTVNQGVADAYSDLQVANAALHNEIDVYGLTQQLANLTQKQFQLGAAPEANSIRAGIALTEEQQNLIAAATQVRLARVALNVQMGRDPSTAVDTAQPLGYGAVTTVDRDAILDLASRSRPEIASANAAVTAAQANVGLERAQSIPDLTLGRQLDVGPVSVGLILPLDLGSIKGSVRKAQEDVQVQQFQAKQIKLSAAQDVENAWLNLKQTQAQVLLYQQGILPQSESLLNRVTQGFSLGASTILDVVDAQQTYRSTRNNYYTAIGAYNHAVDQINRAVGSPVAAMPTGSTFVPAVSPALSANGTTQQR